MDRNALSVVQSPHLHQGIDIPAPPLTAVFAVEGGPPSVTVELIPIWSEDL